MDDNDDGARVGLWVVLGVITLLLFGLVGGLALRSVQTRQAPAPAARAPAAVDVLVDGPLAGATVGTLVFAAGKAELPADATAALAPVLAALAAKPGGRLLIAGYQDAGGDAAAGLALASQRARAVRAAITSQGVDAARVTLRLPQPAAADGPADAARRVDVRLVD